MSICFSYNNNAKEKRVLKMSNKETNINSEQELRILYIFESLNKGQVVSKKGLAEFFDVDEKTIRRDIDKIRRYYIHYQGLQNSIVYDRSKGGYIAKKRLRLSNDEIFALIKMLIENRTFNKQETQSLYDHLLSLGTKEEQKFIKEITGYESLKYENYLLKRERPAILNRLWELAEHIKNKDELIIKNKKQNNSQNIHIVYPVDIIFSEYYFYLIVYYKDAPERGPRIFRVDRIITIEPTDNHYTEDFTQLYRQENFKEKLQLMYSGEKIHLQFRFWGASIDAVMDRLENAETKKLSDDSYLVKATVYDKGIKMWLLSQMEFVEVLSPESFRNEIALTIQKMSALYDTASIVN